MHPLLRLLGWCLLVASLVGVLWPERPDTQASTTLGATAEEPAARQVLPPGREAAPSTTCGGCHAFSWVPVEGLLGS